GVWPAAPRTDAPIVTAVAAPVRKSRIMRFLLFKKASRPSGEWGVRSNAQAIRRSQPVVSSTARKRSFICRNAQRGMSEFAIAPLPKRGRPLKAWRKKLAAFGAVDTAEQRRREFVGGAVVNDLACFQGNRAGAVGQRIFDLVEGDENRDPVLLVHV